MQKSHSAAVNLLAAGMMLVGSGYAYAQQTPAATTKTAPPATTQKAPAKKAPAAAPAAKSVAPSEFKSREEKFSYALGMSYGTGLGSNLKKQSVDINPNLVIQGFKDGLTGAKTQLTEQEAQAVLQEVGTEVRKAQQDKQQKLGEANKTEGAAFLTANKAKEGVVTLPSGLQYKILTEGKGPKPTATDSVVCNYRGTLINGTEFDSSYKRGQPATFPVTGVIKGWTEALELMPVGSKWQLFIPSNLAYGERGAGADIGPDATLIFEVELLSIQEKAKEAAKEPATVPAKEPAKEQAKEPAKDQTKEPPKDQEKK
jgi:FKBP-type peptidyl-prolyl cis-trans isomerase